MSANSDSGVPVWDRFVECGVGSFMDATVQSPDEREWVRLNEAARPSSRAPMFGVVVVSREVGYGEDGSYEYTEIGGVIGPFDTREAAEADNKRLVRDRDVVTEVVEFTAPGGDWVATRFRPSGQ